MKSASKFNIRQITIEFVWNFPVTVVMPIFRIFGIVQIPIPTKELFHTWTDFAATR